VSPKLLCRAVGAAVCVASLVFWRAAGQESGRQTLIDARSAIGRIEGNDPEAKIERAESEFNANMRAFAVASDGMAPEVAASRWLALLDEAIAIPHRSVMGAMGGAPPVPIGTLHTVLITLPRPLAWTEIRKIVDQRPPSEDRTALQILCARLMGDNEAVVRLSQEYDRQAPKRRGQVRQGSPTTSIRIAALSRLGRRLDKQTIEELLSDGSGEESLPWDQLTDQEAREVVLDVIKRTGGNVDFRNRRISKLAQQAILAHLTDFPKPLWLAGDGQIYIEKLVEHYGFASLLRTGEVPDEVTRLYLRKLLLEGKADLAAKLLAQGGTNNYQIGPDDWGDQPKNLYRTVTAVQAKVPNRNLWDLYASAAVACGHIPAAIARLEAQLGMPKTTRRVKLGILANLIDLHCRIGDLKGVAADLDATQKVKRLPRPAVQGPFSDDDFDPSYQALKIGLASKDAGLIGRGLAYEKQRDENYVDPEVFQALSLQRRYGELEALEIRALRKSSGVAEWLPRFATELCEIYYQTNRPRDILTMLRDFPYWSASDVSKIDSGSAGRSFDDKIGEEPSMGFYAAWAFAKTGQTSLALRTLRNVLLLHSGSLQPYELLNEIGDASSLATYADLIRAHPSSPMPVLWKADLLLRLGRSADADTSVRKALAIDPSSAYPYREKLLGLMAEISKRKGDIVSARRYADQVRAVSLAARADDLTNAGLLSMAASALRQATAIWPDDPVVQAQLAECLGKECRHSEAEVHRAQAIENLPAAIGENSDGPGPISGILYSESDRVLALLDNCVKKHPKDAKAYYARGVVYARADRPKEAIKDLEQAVMLDPKLYLAWNELASVSRFGLISPARAQQFALTAIGLDPLASPFFGGSNLESVSDLASAYEILRNRLNGFPTLDGRPIFPLHAAEPERRVIDWPQIDPLDKANRYVGELFSGSSDIRAIAGLYHPTGFPFE
jgi:tetratricopeptide (TPR) repeat protein